MKRDELEAEVQRLTRSRAWYIAAYQRLRNSQAQKRAAPSSPKPSVQKDFTLPAVQPSPVRSARVVKRAERARKARQYEMLRETMKRSAERPVAIPSKSEDGIGSRLKRCQGENARLRVRIQLLEAELQQLRNPPGPE